MTSHTFLVLHRKSLFRFVNLTKSEKQLLSKIRWPIVEQWLCDDKKIIDKSEISLWHKKSVRWNGPHLSEIVENVPEVSPSLNGINRHFLEKCFRLLYFCIKQCFLTKTFLKKRVKNKLIQVWRFFFICSFRQSLHW
jgi:hypothetical protein